MVRLMWHGGTAAPGWEPLVELTLAHIKDFDAGAAIDDGNA